MKSEKMYSVAIRKKQAQHDFFWNHEDYLFEELNVDCQSRYWLADPFLFEKGGKVYVFYEAFDLISRKGLIGYSLIDGKRKKIPVHIILDKPYHLSFPNVFEHDGDIYMMPETCENNTVKLFKATSFPEIWEENKLILPEVFACDSIILQDKSKNNYLLVNEMYRGETPTGNYSSCWVKNVCYKLNNSLQVIETGKLVAEGDCGIRNAGKSFYADSQLYRIGQNSPNKLYGKGLVLFEVESIEPYKEKLIWIKDSEVFGKHIIKFEDDEIIGVHTYNFSEHYEVIDFSQIRKWRLATLILKKRQKVFDTIKYYLWAVVNKYKRVFCQG